MTKEPMTYKFLHLPTLNSALDDNSLEMSIKTLTHCKCENLDDYVLLHILNL